MRLPFLMVAALLSAPLSAGAQAPDRVDHISAQNFQTTVKQLESALQSRAFMVVSRANHQNMLQMVGAKTKGALSIDFGKPDMLKTLLPAHPELGLEMPMRMYVFERADGKTVVSFHLPSSLFAPYGADLKMMGGMMDKMFHEIAAEATS